MTTEHRSVEQTAYQLLGRSDKQLCAVVTLCSMVSTAAGLSLPFLIGAALDILITTGDHASALFGIAGGFLAAVLTQACTRYVARRQAAVLGQRILRSHRDATFVSLLATPLPVLGARRHGDIYSRVSRDVDAVALAAREALPGLVVGVAGVALTIIAMFINNIVLTLPSIALLACAVPFVIRYLRRSGAVYDHVARAHGDYLALLSETYSHQGTLLSLGLRDTRTAAVLGRLQAIVVAERSALALRNQLFPALDTALIAPQVCTVATGVTLLSQGTIQLGDLATAVLLVGMLSGPFRIVVAIDRLQLAFASMRRLAALAEGSGQPNSPVAPAPSRNPAPTSVQTVPPQRGAVSLHEVTYTYRDNAPPAIANINLEIAPGEHVAVVGASGSGKSTLAALIAGFLPVTAGSLLVSGSDLALLSSEDCRRLVILVTQEQYGFRATLHENVALGNELFSPEQSASLLRELGAAQLLEQLPQGVHTRLEASRLDLTPADLQRIALARSLTLTSDVIILDEATTDLADGDTQVFRDFLDLLPSGRTLINVVHNMDEAALADRVIVLEAGVLVAEGSHQELLRASSVYREMWGDWNSVG